MKQIFTSKKNVILIFFALSLVLIGISCFFLFMNIWEPILMLSTGTIFSGLYLILVLYFGNDAKGLTTLNKPANMVIFTLLKSLIIFASLIVDALVLYFVKPTCLIDGYEKGRYLFILLNLATYFLSVLFYYLNVRANEQK